MSKFTYEKNWSADRVCLYVCRELNDLPIFTHRSLVQVFLDVPQLHSKQNQGEK